MHPSSNILNLADVIYNSQNAEGLAVNLLVAVRDMGSLQTVKTKDGREAKRLQLSVFDQSHPVFPVIIWEAETANFLLKYCYKKCVLLISDIKVNYNAFMKEMAATSGSTTIFTPEPEIADGRVLYQYAMKVSLPNEDMENANRSDPSAVYTVGEIMKLMYPPEMMVDEIQGTVYALISAFDIDGITKITSWRCPGCLQLLQKADEKCINGTCEIGSGMKVLPAEKMYDIVISLSDSTGSLSRCLLTGQIAQNLLEHTVQEFLLLSDDDKTALKWQYLFERFIVQFKVLRSLAGNGRPIFRILNLQKAEF